jgi:hypothetical protein
MCRLGKGSVIEAGNWGRIISSAGWTHPQAIREAALEEARRLRFHHRPSRLASVFAFLSASDAQHFAAAETASFRFHVLHRVRLAEPNAISFIADWRLIYPTAPFRPDWADAYWLGASETASHSTPIIKEGMAEPATFRELVTLSPLVVEECFD